MVRLSGNRQWTILSGREFFARPCLAVFLLTLFTVSPVRAEFFTIESFDSHITVSDNANLIVQEKITVQFTSRRHGIFRDIPFRFTSEQGGKVLTPLTIVSVTDESGEERPLKVTTVHNVRRIRIGHPDKYVSGRQIYIINYLVDNALLFHEGSDELVWNVTGNDWRVPIARATAAVTFLPGPEAIEFTASCYTGGLGSVGRDCVVERGTRSVIFTSNRPLRAREGMTVAASWAAGVVQRPSDLRLFLWRLNLRENGLFLITVAGLLFIFGHWFSVGRDPAIPGSVAVQYGPPRHREKDLTPAEVGGLVDERLDSRDLTAAIIGLAVKGYIEIEEMEMEGLIFKKSDYFLRKKMDADDELTGFEKELMRALFSSALPGVLISELKNNFYTNLDALKMSLFSGLVEKGYFRKRPGRTREDYRVYGVILAVAGGLLGFGLAKAFTATMLVKNIAALASPGIVMMLAARFMPAKTRRGVRARRHVLGLEEFLQRAEKDRLARMKDLNLFEKFLPYAIALDVSDRWAEAFEGIRQEPPQWYRGRGWGGDFHPSTFNNSLSSALSDMRSTMYSAPRSSGSGGGSFSGGGGFSGGGFGGGGGGSW